MRTQIETKQEEIKQQLYKTQRELTVLYEISNAMRTTLELNRILYIILTGVTAHSGLGFNRALLFLVNTKERCLEPKMAIGPESGEHANHIWSQIAASNQGLEDLTSQDKLSDEEFSNTLFDSVKDLKIPLDKDVHNLLANAYHKGSPLLINQEEIRHYTNDPLLSVFPTNELVIVPLKAKDKINGLIIADNIFNQKPITEDDVKIFVMLANQAGLAIENSQLYEMAVHRSNTDSLTYLWNHGFFQYALTVELEKAKANNTSLTLLMVDLDNFKQLNDTYGHKYGDVILARLAKLFKDSSREVDYVCRYGGEEFAFILTQIDKEHGREIAERLRKQVAEYKFSEPNVEQKLNITVSIGVASFPDDAYFQEDLIAKADKAMYVAKFCGKNQTCAAEKSS